MSYPIIKSNDCCQVKKNSTTVKYCVIKADSLKENEIRFDAITLKADCGTQGIIKPEKSTLRYRFAKPEHIDQSMVVKPESDIQMR